MHLEEAQIGQEAKDAVHHPAVEQVGEEVPGEDLPQHRREGGVRSQPEHHGDSDQDLVPEQEGEGEENRGGGGVHLDLRLIALLQLDHTAFPHPRSSRRQGSSVPALGELQAMELETPFAKVASVTGSQLK